MDDYSSFFQASAPLVSAGVQAVGTKLKYKYTKQLQDEQNAFNLQMWNLQNEYNSPQAQMQRFKDAGLNPNLIYGQGSSGNATSAPVQGVPDSPDYTPAMKELSELFNIENLRTIRAHRKKAEADADNARTDANRNDLEFQAEHLTGLNYTYNYTKGKWEPRPKLGPNEVRVIHPSSYYMNRIFENNYNRAHLIPIKERLYEPEIWMRNYDKQYYPVTYWIGQGTRAIHGVSEAVGMFNPTKWILPKRPPITYNNTYRNIYYKPF